VSAQFYSGDIVETNAVVSEMKVNVIDLRECTNEDAEDKYTHKVSHVQARG
jgi:hypothetical protein